jgi:hypothetical protein
MEKRMETRTVRIHLPDGGSEFSRNIPVTMNVGTWKTQMKRDNGWETGKLKCRGEVFLDEQTFADTPDAELQFIGVVQQSAVAVAPAGSFSLR